MRVLVAGSRELVLDFETLDDSLKVHVESKLNSIQPWPITVVTGGARGPDSTGHKWAKHSGFFTEVFNAEWGKYGRRAGYIRNIKMADSGLDFAIIAWDGESKGTKMMLDILETRDVPYDLITQPSGDSYGT